MVDGLSDLDLQSWTKCSQIPVVSVLIISFIEISCVNCEKGDC